MDDGREKTEDGHQRTDLREYMKGERKSIRSGIHKTPFKTLKTTVGHRFQK